MFWKLWPVTGHMMHDIQFYFLYVRRHALDYYFPKHVYSVVRSPSQCKENLVNFRSYYNCRRFGVLLTPGVNACKFSSLFFLLFSCTKHYRSFRFFWRKNRTFLSSFHASAVNSRTSLILINAIESCWPPSASLWLTWRTPVPNATRLRHWLGTRNSSKP